MASIALVVASLFGAREWAHRQDEAEARRLSLAVRQSLAEAARDAKASDLKAAIAELKAEARAAGLGDADIDAELAAHNAERRDRSSG